MSAPLISPPSPTRLLCRRGRWTLELQRLEPIERNVFQTKRVEVSGGDAILSQLKRVADGAAVTQSTLQVMRATRGDEDRTFDFAEGEWIPSASETELTSASEVAAEALVAELRAEVMMLRGSYKRLRARVAALEACVEDIPVREQPPEPASKATPATLAQVAVAAPLPAALDLPQATPTLTSAVAPPVQSVPPAAPPPVHPFREVVAALGPEKAPTRQIALPSGEQIVSALSELFGADPGFAVADEPLPDSALELAALYAGRLVDEEGNDVGTVLAELKSTVHLGGKLMGLPNTVIEEQARTSVLSEDVLSAMSEICNTLASSVSKVAGNGAIRATPVELFAPDRLRWLSSARESVALARSRVGTAWIVAR